MPFHGYGPSTRSAERHATANLERVSGCGCKRLINDDNSDPNSMFKKDTAEGGEEVQYLFDDQQSQLETETLRFRISMSPGTGHSAISRFAKIYFFAPNRASNT